MAWNTADYSTSWGEDDGLLQQYIAGYNPLHLPDMNNMSLDAECSDIVGFLELISSELELADGDQLVASAPWSILDGSNNSAVCNGQYSGPGVTQEEVCITTKKLAAIAMEEEEEEKVGGGDRNNVDQSNMPKDCEDNGMCKRLSTHKRRKLNLSSSSSKKLPPTSAAASYVDDDLQVDNTNEDYKKKSKRSSKNLNYERQRRKMLNAKLHALRSLVPKISKMDKASIVSDAISYVLNLRSQIDGAHEEVQALRLWESNCIKKIARRVHNDCIPIKNQIEYKIIQVDVTIVEKEVYQLDIICYSGQGVIANLTKAVEMLGIDIVNANLTTIDDRILNTIFVEMRNGVGLEPHKLRDMVLRVARMFGLGHAKEKIIDTPS